MSTSVVYVGMDVHKDSIVIALAREGREAAQTWKTIPNDGNLLRKALKMLRKNGEVLKVCYEAGPTGFGLYRSLRKAGIDCIVVAPSLVPSKAGERVKTDRRDAKKLAHFLRSGDLTEVYVPDEAVATIAAETGGDLKRFATAGQFMSYVGLVPSEDSTGKRRRQGAITRCGNKHLRRILVEAAWHYRHTPGMSKELRRRNQGVATGVQRIAWEAQKRLNQRMYHLLHAGKSVNKAVIAMARELAGFIWSVGQEKTLLEAK
jgi:transposase